MSADEVHSVVLACVAAWGEADDDARRRLLNQCWADDGEYLDPRIHAAGRAALRQAMAAFQQQWVGHRFILTSAAEHHHGFLRFIWRWLDAQGAPVRNGMDFGELASDGRLQRIIGYFTPLPATE
jgi:hypothetical protein